MSLLGFIKKPKKTGARQHGTLSDTVMDAMRLWDEQKAGGVSLADRQRGLFGVLRDAWPQVREWKYLCQNCNDTGLVMAECSGDATCGRVKLHLPHEFGTPCWCSLGSRFKQQSKPTPEDFTQAGRSKPTRIGRRN